MSAVVASPSTGGSNVVLKGSVLLSSRDQLVKVLQDIYDGGATSGGDEEVDLLEVDDYDFGANTTDEGPEEDHEKLTDLLEKLKNIFGSSERTDDFTNTFFAEEDDAAEHGVLVAALSAANRLKQLEKAISFLTSSLWAPNSESDWVPFFDSVKSLTAWRIAKLLDVFETRLKELPAAPADPAASGATDTESAETILRDTLTKCIKEFGVVLKEKASKESLIPPPEATKRKKSTPDMLGRVLGLSFKGDESGGFSILGSLSQSGSSSAIGIAGGLSSLRGLASTGGNSSIAPTVNVSTTSGEIDKSPVVEKYSRFGKKVTKQNLIDAGILVAEQPDNPIELKWQDIENKTVEGNKGQLISPCDGYSLELGREYPSEVSSVTSLLYLQDAEKTIPFYEKYFYGKEHVNVLGMGDGSMGGICISIEMVSKEKEMARALIRTKNGEDRILIPASQKPKDLVKTLKSGYPEYDRLKLSIIKDPELHNELLQMEKKLMFKTYKFGVLYCKDGQTDEVDMFQNVDESPGFVEFLEFLGQKTKLQGWTGFRGGLDVKNNSTGLNSVYTKHRGFEIMFHVSTMLPFNADDVQQLERKRHLGNDIIVIVYKEGDTPYSPTTIRSEFNHVFCVVQKEPGDGPTKYRVGFACKAGVKPFNPLMKAGVTFEKSDSFRDFFLTKLINAERMAFYAPDFAQKMLRTRKMMLENLYNNFCKKNDE